MIGIFQEVSIEMFSPECEERIRVVADPEGQTWARSIGMGPGLRRSRLSAIVREEAIVRYVRWR